MDSAALRGWDDVRPAGPTDIEGQGRTADIGSPAALILAAIDSTELYDGHAVRRAALKLTSRIPDAALAADLTEELFLAIEAVQIEVELGGSDAPLLGSWRADARRALERIEAAGRQ